MAGKPYKRGKRGAGRHVQLPEYLQSTDAWARLKPGPRALYVELKRRYNGTNNGRLILSHRDAAKMLNVHRNTVGPWFVQLQEHGLIHMTVAPYLGPSGIGQAALWALQEFPTVDGKAAMKGFMQWRYEKKPRTKSVHPRHDGCDTSTERPAQRGATVLKIVT